MNCHVQDSKSSSTDRRSLLRAKDRFGMRQSVEFQACIVPVQDVVIVVARALIGVRELKFLEAFLGGDTMFFSGVSGLGRGCVSGLGRCCGRHGQPVQVQVLSGLTIK